MYLSHKETMVITEHLKKSVQEGDFLLDGVDVDSYANSKTEYFVDTYGIDEVLEVLEEMLSVNNYWRQSPSRNWAEVPAVEYKDCVGLSAKYSNRLYVKVFHYDDGKTPVFVIHD